MGMNGSQQREVIEQIRLEVERIRVDFTMSQIETAYALARSAQTFYLSGSTEQAESVQSKAWQAYQGAVDLLTELSADSKLCERLTTDKLSKVRAILESLPPSPVKRRLVIAGK
jgi:hypothetical protein